MEGLKSRAPWSIHQEWHILIRVCLSVFWVCTFSTRGRIHDWFKVWIKCCQVDQHHKQTLFRDVDTWLFFLHLSIDLIRLPSQLLVTTSLWNPSFPLNSNQFMSCYLFGFSFFFSSFQVRVFFSQAFVMNFYSKSLVLMFLLRMWSENEKRYLSWRKTV
jgi:hypothetical protein